MADFDPKAVRSVLTAAGIAEREPRANVTGCRVTDARDRLGEILVEAEVALKEPPYMTRPEKIARTQFTARCYTALADAGYLAQIVSPSLIVITEGAAP